MVQTTLASLWANATFDAVSASPDSARTMHEDDTCHIHHDPVAVYLSSFLCIGLIISYLPQIIRIIRNKSSQGFSPWFLLLGATSAASSFLNVVSLQWGIVRCCPELPLGECTESLLGIFQVGTQWAMFSIVFILFLVYYPKDLRYERAIALPEQEQQAQLQQDRIARARARKAAKRASAKRSRDDEAAPAKLAVPQSKSSMRNSTDDASSGGSENSDLDSIDSHIAANYAANGSGAAEDPATSSDEGDDSNAAEVHAEELDEDEDDVEALRPSRTRRHVSSARPDASSSAFSRLAPTFWPMWKAPGSNEPQAGSAQSSQQLVASAPRGMRRIERERRAKLSSRRPKTRKRKTEEWSLAIALAWVVLIHFIFITSITLLLVSSLPAKSFPSPEEVSSLGVWHRAVVTLHQASMMRPSSRLLVSRWATFLGTSATVLAMGQYLPQIVHTARTQLVGSLSIPMMSLQVPGTAVFVYALALQPGTDWSSLAAYCLTGVFQLILLVLCVSWRIRQHRAGIDDFGRPLAPVAL
ncbi:hypothetical protein BCV70DRAFT_10509 [Testicularia cyperi]|uniref:PQ-loop-domain-containing protein n=1 Tax=Testicularia cyperi TaxID=1882483 RepID=A0A317Y0G5_9BASI|nr:hypothetical protein BCV70DRAFT_10509 [Testicularia cyperi]